VAIPWGNRDRNKGGSSFCRIDCRRGATAILAHNCGDYAVWCGKLPLGTRPIHDLGHSGTASGTTLNSGSFEFNRGGTDIGATVDDSGALAFSPEARRQHQPVFLRQQSAD
jgi:hypothetical protein